MQGCGTSRGTAATATTASSAGHTSCTTASGLPTRCCWSAWAPRTGSATTLAETGRRFLHQVCSCGLRERAHRAAQPAIAIVARCGFRAAHRVLLVGVGTKNWASNNFGRNWMAFPLPGALLWLPQHCGSSSSEQQQLFVAAVKTTASRRRISFAGWSREQELGHR